MKIKILMLVILLSSCATKKNAEYYFQQGKNAVAATSDDVAISNFTKAIKKNPEYIDAYLERAKVSLSIDSIQNAISDYDSVLVKTDRNDYEKQGKLYLMKGDAYYRLSEDTLACKCYKQSQKLNNAQSWDRIRNRCRK